MLFGTQSSHCATRSALPGVSRRLAPLRPCHAADMAFKSLQKPSTSCQVSCSSQIVWALSTRRYFHMRMLERGCVTLFLKLCNVISQTLINVIHNAFGSQSPCHTAATVCPRALHCALFKKPFTPHHLAPPAGLLTCGLVRCCGDSSEMRACAALAARQRPVLPAASKVGGRRTSRTVIVICH